MKKQLFIAVISSLFLTANLYCQVVDQSVAQNVATSKIQNLGYSINFQLKSYPDLFFDDLGNPLFFAFQIEPVGYMMVSANQMLPPVVAYSFTNNYKSSESEENILLEMIKKDQINRLKNIQMLDNHIKQNREGLWDQLLSSNSVADKKFDQWPPSGTTTTGGWLETNWKQGAPYNDFCPMDPVTNQRSIAGCPSVAIAMLINYYETLNETELSDTEDDYYHSYSGRNYWVDDDFEEIDFMPFPDINAYFDTISSSYSNNSPLKTTEKSALVWACGVTAKQVYTSSISGTFGVSQAYDAFLRFGFNESILLDEDDPTILEHLALNMMEARPALLAVVDPGVAGHNLVTDGYNTDGFYHLNFGWGGSYNGWYLVPDEIPYNLTVFEGVIVDIAYPPVNTLVSETNTQYSEINVYPNPATDYINIDWAMGNNSDIVLELIDILGNTCYQKYFDRLAKEHSLTINDYELRNLSPGIYFCTIKSNGNSITEKVIIQ